MPRTATGPPYYLAAVVAAWVTNSILWDIQVEDAGGDRAAARKAYLGGLELDAPHAALDVATSHPAAAGLLEFSAIAFG